MKSTAWLLLFFFILLSQKIYPQDFSKVDEHAKNTPGSMAATVEKLAEHLTKDWESEQEKVRAIYVWLAENIKYSTREEAGDAHSVEQHLKKQEPERVLQSKRAVCEGYSNLFQALCRAAGLRSLIVTGYTKNDDGKLAPIGHAWNIVSVGGQWRHLDATWGAGGVDSREGKYVKNLSEAFFLANAADFIQHHLPHDPMFQLLPEPVSFDFFKKNKKIKVVEDRLSDAGMAAIDLHFQLGESEQLMASCQRALDFDPADGFCNFTISKHHYEQALAAYQLFFQDSQRAFSQKLPLTTPMVTGWEKHLEEYRRELVLAEGYLKNVRAGDPVAAVVLSSKEAIKQAWRTSKETEKQFEEYHRYLVRTGR